jgi:membrane protein implicated in regulation of membrane protease activity
MRRARRREMQGYIYWLIAGVVALILELMSGTLFLIWVSGGCLVAGIAAWLFPVPWVPWFVFVAATSALLYFGLPLAQRVRERPGQPSNVDQMIGRHAVVLETIDPIENTGRVRYASDEWRARSDHRIEAGVTVDIERVEGTTLMVTDASSQEQAC